MLVSFVNYEVSFECFVCLFSFSEMSAKHREEIEEETDKAQQTINNLRKTAEKREKKFKEKLGLFERQVRKVI